MQILFDQRKESKKNTMRHGLSSLSSVDIQSKCPHCQLTEIEKEIFSIFPPPRDSNILIKTQMLPRYSFCPICETLRKLEKKIRTSEKRITQSQKGRSLT